MNTGCMPDSMKARSRRAMTYLRAMRPEDILLPTPAGLCCKLGGFHIDPTRPVDKAVITHGHSDHARPGHSSVLATQETLDLMALRYGGNFAGTTQAARYGESLTIGGATVTFRPAGHVLGSGQVAVEDRKSTCLNSSHQIISYAVFCLKK